MAINIKNERVIELARFADGSQTGAIERALQEFLEARHREAPQSRADLVWSTLDAMDVRLDASRSDALQESMEGLYGDDGLPA